MQTLTIGKAAEKAGVGVETIRFYERRGLIEQPRKPGDAGFRVYSTDTIQRVRFIRRAQDLGFSLRQIQELLALRTDPSADCGDVRATATAKVEEVNQKIAELKEILAALHTVIDACPGRGALGACTILEALDAVQNGQPKRSQSSQPARSRDHEIRNA
jgi:MerR family mercuric resistance operon transcriptional regulator